MIPKDFCRDPSTALRKSYAQMSIVFPVGEKFKSIAKVKNGLLRNCYGCKPKSDSEARARSLNELTESCMCSFLEGLFTFVSNFPTSSFPEH